MDTKPKFKLTIDRTKWGKGVLYDSFSGRMCALGFLGEAVGIPKEELSGRASPDSVEFGIIKWAAVGIMECDGSRRKMTDAAHAVMAVNDGAGNGGDIIAISREEMPSREARLKEIFSSVNIEVDFVG